MGKFQIDLWLILMYNILERMCSLGNSHCVKHLLCWETYDLDECTGDSFRENDHIHCNWMVEQIIKESFLLKSGALGQRSQDGEEHGDVNFLFQLQRSRKIVHLNASLNTFQSSYVQLYISYVSGKFSCSWLFFVFIGLFNILFLHLYVDFCCLFDGFILLEPIF